MKKTILSLLGLTATCAVFAQNRPAMPVSDGTPVADVTTSFMDAANKTAAVGDTNVKRNFAPAYVDSLIAYIVNSPGTPADSGFVYGTNPYNYKGWAERYDYNGVDSTVRVIGVVAVFNGRAQSASTKTINFKIWNAASRSSFFPGTTRAVYYSGLPGTTVLAQAQNVNIRQLGINPTGADTFKRFNFTNTTGILTDTFFCGYDLNFASTALGGDTIGLYSTLQGRRFNSPGFYVSGTDTIINVKNAAQDPTNAWEDAFQEYFGLFHHLAIFPVVVRTANGIDGVSHNDLTFYGSYPNPAQTSTNVKIGLKAATGVTILVTDITGRAVQVVQKSKLTAGVHEINVPTSELPAGQYTYIIRTDEGGGMASQFTVVK